MENKVIFWQVHFLKKFLHYDFNASVMNTHFQHRYVVLFELGGMERKAGVLNDQCSRCG